MNSHDRTSTSKPAYWVNSFGVFKEVAMPNHRPLYWGREPLSKARLKELFEQAERSPLVFARLIEQEHGIQKDDTPQDNHM
jgi:hypothetical protein